MQVPHLRCVSACLAIIGKIQPAKGLPETSIPVVGGPRSIILMGVRYIGLMHVVCQVETTKTKHVSACHTDFLKVSPITYKRGARKHL